MYWDEIHKNVDDILLQYGFNSNSFDEKNMIIDATKRFNNKEIPAKVLRQLCKYISNESKIDFLNNLYNKDVVKENMERLPPSVLLQDLEKTGNLLSIKLASKMLGYVLIEEYDKSTKTNQLERFKKVINRCENNQQMQFENNNAYYESTVKNKAINIFVNHIVDRNLKGEVKPLGLPKSMNFGVELEFVKIYYKDFQKLVKSLKKYNINFFDGFDIKRDISVKKADSEEEICWGIDSDEKKYLGTEVVSPVLKDCEEDWTRLQKVMTFIKCVGSVTNSTCGGHIHIDANVLGYDTIAWHTCSDVYAMIEPLFYNISNRRGEKVRDGACEYAKETAENLERIEWKDVIINNVADLEKFVRHVAMEKRLQQNRWGTRTETEFPRYKSLNLTPIMDNRKPNTMEFRVFNGTIDYSILRENVLLAGSHVKSAKLYSISSDEGIERNFKLLFEQGLSEKEMLIRYLNFLFGDKDEYKAIFYDRWASKVGRNSEKLDYMSIRQWNGTLPYKKQYNSENVKKGSYIGKKEVYDIKITKEEKER